MEDLLKDYAIIVETPVDWGDMDAFQHVNNVMYFRYFENARVLYGEKCGIVNRMYTEGLGPILSWTDCKYIRPLTYPDVARVGVRAVSIEGPEMKLEYKLVSATQGIVAAVGTSLGVFYDYRNKRKTDMPADVIASIEKIEGRTIPRKHQ